MFLSGQILLNEYIDGLDEAKKCALAVDFTKIVLKLLWENHVECLQETHYKVGVCNCCVLLNLLIQKLKRSEQSLRLDIPLIWIGFLLEELIFQVLV